MGRLRTWNNRANTFDRGLKMLYPEGIPHKESTMEARSIVVGTLGKAEC